MTQMEKVKSELSKTDDSMEMAEILERIMLEASNYCNGNYPDLVIIENIDGETMVKVHADGLRLFLESKAE